MDEIHAVTIVAGFAYGEPLKGLSRVWRNSYARFLGGWGAVMRPGYPIDYGKMEVLPMPETYVREMIADWKGAGMAITGKDDPADWYTKNGAKFLMHDKTREIIYEILRVLCDGGEGNGY